MNDPGLDDAIAEEADALDHTSSQHQNGGNGIVSADERDASGLQRRAEQPLSPRWWLASTAYPLAAVCTFPEIMYVAILTLVGNFRSNG